MQTEPQPPATDVADPPPYPGTPPWVKMSAIVAGVLVLLVVILLLAGGGPGRHGPARHTSSGDGAGQTQPGDRRR